jgi:hypothetical protein
MAGVGHVIDLLDIMVLEDLEDLVAPINFGRGGLRRGGGHVSPIPGSGSAGTVAITAAKLDDCWE